MYNFGMTGHEKMLRKELTPGGFSALLNAAVDAIIIIDQNAQILSFNVAAENLFGYSAGELENTNVNVLMPSPYYEEHDGYLDEYYRTGVKKIIGIGRRVEAKKADGTIFPIELSVGEYSEHGKTYFVGIIRDLTEKEQFNQALMESEQALHVTLDNAPIGIITTTVDGQVQSANQAIFSLTGYREDDLTGRLLTDILHPEETEQAKTNLEKILNGRESSITFDTRLTRKDGEVAHAVVHCSRVETGVGHQPQKLIVQLVDRTSEVNAELQANEFRERLAHVDRVSTMGEMASGIAHEINQPLTAISSYVQACRRRLDSEDTDLEKLKELLEKTGDQALRAGTIVQRIRSLIKSRVQHQERVIVNKLVTDAIQLAKADATSRGIVLFTELPESSHEIIADPIQIQQVILNLVRNAVDATEQGGNKMDGVTIGVRDGFRRDEVEIWVRDRGSGIPDSIKDRLFEPFMTSKSSGTGMGLSISRSIIDAHGGKLWVESEKNSTTFRISLPTAIGES